MHSPCQTGCHGKADGKENVMKKGRRSKIKGVSEKVNFMPEAECEILVRAVNHLVRQTSNQHISPRNTPRAFIQPFKRSSRVLFYTEPGMVREGVT
jgi:hypothetical protein